MKRIGYLMMALIATQMLFAQTNVISNNKPLGFLNPAINNADYERGIVSASYIINPMSETSNFSNYVVLGEFKLAPSFQIGFHSSTLDTRLNKLDIHKLYTSYGFKFEEGGLFTVGVEAGIHKDRTKLAEFNKVFTPTIYQFEDSIAQGMDIGVGVAFSTDNFTMGLSLNKLNKPSVVPHPFQHWAFKSTDSTVIVKKDTTVRYTEADFEPSNIQSNLNVMYSWEAGSVKVLHSLHIANLDFEGYGYLGFQNFITFNEKLAVGLGLYENGELSYFASLGYAISPAFKIELASFIHEEFEFDASAPYPLTKLSNGNTVEANGDYISNGYKPTLEFNLQYKF